MKIYKVGVSAALLLGVLVMAYAGYRLLEADNVYKEGNSVYEDLGIRVRSAAAGGALLQGMGAEAPQRREDMEAPPEGEWPIGPDFALLKSISGDAAAWLHSPGTAIDYPVMAADDYSYYLNHLSDGTANANGALFIDYNNASDFSGPLTVIYGHNMKSGRMFGSLEGYKRQAYFEEHPYMYLYTEAGDYRLDVLYGCVIGAGEWSSQAYMREGNLEALLAYAGDNTTFESGAVYEEGDRIVALSTCSYEFNDARYVVLGALRS